MARLFDDASTQFLTTSNGIASIPFTMACWFKTDADGVSQSLMSPTNTASANNYFRLDVRMDIAGDPVTITSIDGTVAEGGETTTGVTINTWNHACGVFASTTSRSVYLNGGSKATSTNFDSPSGQNRCDIGTVYTGGASYLHMSGSIAEAAMWGVALTDAEVAILALGYSPLLVRPQSLVAYWPLIGRTSPEIDLVGGYDLTLVNAPTTAAHPRIIYPPNMQSGLTIPGAPPAGAIMPQFQYANLGASLYNGTLIG